MHSQTCSLARRLVTTAPGWVLTFTLGVASPIRSVSAQTAGRIPDQLSLEAEPKLTQYRALRRMHASNEKYHHEAWLEAWTELDGRGFRYQIVSERGSEYIRHKVFKALLERERQIVAAGEAGRGDISPANYEFVEADAHGRGVRYILLKPRRKDMLLVDGRMVMNQDGTELLRVEGRLARNPSFWTSLVNVIREFALVDGVRVPVAQESIAKMKLAGISRMTVHYEYETVNGRPVSSAARRMLAPATGRE